LEVKWDKAYDAELSKDNIKATFTKNESGEAYSAKFKDTENVKTTYVSLYVNSENKAKEDIEACIDLNIYETESSDKLSLSFKIDNSSKELILYGQDGNLIDSCKYKTKLLENTIVRFHKN